tara:strand:- start:269 stop:904 length:636 start_codon:yes stop_codon:yes gene_type:complete
MPVSKTKTKRFWDKTAEKYAKDPIADEASYRTKLNVTRDYLGPEMRVLEFGCGTGTTALYHAPAVAEIDAFDISDAMIAIARKKAGDQGIANVRFQQGDIDALAGSAGRYDVVMAHSILHLLEDRQSVIAKVHAMLKPGGVFISSTACLGDFSFYIRAAIPLMQMVGKAPHVGMFTENQFVAEMEAAGFVIAHRWCPGKNKAAFLVARKAG